MDLPACQDNRVHTLRQLPFCRSNGDHPALAGLNFCYQASIPEHGAHLASGAGDPPVQCRTPRRCRPIDIADMDGRRKRCKERTAPRQRRARIQGARKRRNQKYGVFHFTLPNPLARSAEVKLPPAPGDIDGAVAEPLQAPKMIGTLSNSVVARNLDAAQPSNARSIRLPPVRSPRNPPRSGLPRRPARHRRRGCGEAQLHWTA